MRMHYRADIRPRLVDAGMEVEFQRRLAVALDHIAVEIDGADIVGGQLAALA